MVSRIEEIRAEIENGDTQKYLENCSNNYTEYINAIEKLYPDLLDRKNRFDNSFSWNDFNKELDNSIESQDIDSQIHVLEKGIKSGLYTPGHYEKLAKAYEKMGDFALAYEVCIKWFESDYWKLPQTSNGSMKILKRMNRLEKKK